MYLGFHTDDEDRARAALILYALYKSRDANSPMMGVDTWTRFESACVGACKKSSTTSEFVTQFKQIAKVSSIKPRYLSDGKLSIIELDGGDLVEMDDIKDYRIEIFEDDEVRKTIERDYPLLVLLVRERLQREKVMYGGDLR